MSFATPGFVELRTRFTEALKERLVGRELRGSEGQTRRFMPPMRLGGELRCGAEGKSFPGQ